MPCRELGSMEFYLGRGYWEGLEGRNTDRQIGGKKRGREKRSRGAGETELPLQKNGWAGLALGGGGEGRVGGAYLLKEQGADREGQHNHTHMTQPVQLLRGQMLGHNPERL